MSDNKEPCGLDITLEDIRRIENQYDVTIYIHFDKYIRAWCFDVERSSWRERQALSVIQLADMSKETFLMILIEKAKDISSRNKQSPL